VGVDPDFITAGDVFTEWYVKAFRSKLNIHGIDFFEAGRGYRLYYSTVMLLLSFAMMILVVLHFVVLGWGVFSSFSWAWLRLLFCSAIALVSVVAFLVNLLIGFPFDTFAEDPVSG
jgi:hypothetical protein